MISIRFIVYFCLSAALSPVLLAADTIATNSIIPVPQGTRVTVPWWHARHQQICERAQNSNPALLMLGDSIMQGWEDEGHAIWQQYYGHRRAANLGFNNDRTEHLLWRLQNGEIDGFEPKIAVVLIGTNNISSGHSARHTALGIKAILTTLRERLPHATIILLAMFPRSASPYDPLRRSIRETNNLIAQYADQEYILYLDLTEKFVDKNGYLLNHLMPDLVHPSRLGYQIMAEAMEDTIQSFLGP